MRMGATPKASVRACATAGLVMAGPLAAEDVTRGDLMVWHCEIAAVETDLAEPPARVGDCLLWLYGSAIATGSSCRHARLRTPDGATFYACRISGGAPLPKPAQLAAWRSVMTTDGPFGAWTLFDDTGARTYRAGFSCTRLSLGGLPERPDCSPTGESARLSPIVPGPGAS